MFRRSKRKLSSPALKRRKKRRLVVATVSVVAIIGSLVVHAHLLSHSPTLSITSIEVVGAETLNEETLRGTAENLLAGSWAGIISKKSAFFFPRKTIEQAIEKDFSGINDIRVSLADQNTLRLTVVEREPHALWCGGQEEDFRTEDTAVNCYFMDESGYIFKQAPQFSDAVYVKYFGSVATSSEADPLSRPYAPSSLIRIQTFLQSLQSLKLEATRVYVRESEVVIRVRSNSEIILSTETPFEIAFENLEAVLIEKGYKPDMPQSMPSFSYIDLRHEHKVWFKP